MSIRENINLDEQFIAAWNAHNPELALQVLADDIRWHDVSSPETLKGKQAARELMQSWFTAFPDLDSVVTNRLVTEDQIACEVEFKGTNTGPLQMAPGMPAIPATGKKVVGHGTYFVRVKGGKAVEIHSYPDSAGLMMQLGLMPTG